MLLDDFSPDDWRLTIPRYSTENFPNILKLCDGLAEMGKKHGATASQVTLAWLLAQGDDIIPIPGSTKIPVRTEITNVCSRGVLELTGCCRI